MNIPIVTANFFRKDALFAQELVDLFLFCIEKNLPQISKVYMLCEEKPQINYCKDKLEFLSSPGQEPDFFEQEEFSIFDAYEQVLSMDTYDYVLCCHTDTLLFNMPSKEYLDKGYFGILVPVDIEDRGYPKDVMKCSTIGTQWGIFNQSKWKELNCYFLDKKLLKNNKNVVDLRYGSVYAYDVLNTFLLSWYLHMSKEKCHFVSGSNLFQHLGGFGVLLKFCYYIEKGYSFDFIINSCKNGCEKRLRDFVNIYTKIMNLKINKTCLHRIDSIHNQIKKMVKVMYTEHETT